MGKKWWNFYSGRIHSDYQDYFEERYKVFLDIVRNLAPKEGIFELGCGIGSVSKTLQRDLLETPFQGIDLCEDMVRLANDNTTSNNFYPGDIFNPSIPVDKIMLKVTHGVLEHFEDSKILEFCSLYPNSVNYVPLDKYETPSFGDERLLPWEYWVDLVNPRAYEVFNDGYDLVFVV